MICNKCQQDEEKFPKKGRICCKCISLKTKLWTISNKERYEERQTRYREENKEKIKNNDKNYYMKNKNIINEKGKKYREENKEKIKEQKKKYNEENKEKIKELRKKYREENKEKIKEQKKKYNEKNRQKINEQSRNYRRDNKHIFKERYIRNLWDNFVRSSKTTDKKKNRENDITIDFLKSLYERSRNCFYCKNEMSLEIGNKKCNQISIDRKDQKLGHIQNNTVLSCLFCNLAKNESSLEDFLIFLKGLKGNEISLENNEEYKEWDKILFKKTKSRNKNTDIDLEWFKNQMINQENKCYHSGLPLIVKKSKYIFKPSIERLDCNKSYTKDNCVLVCLGINYGRLNNDLEYFKKYLESIKHNNNYE